MAVSVAMARVGIGARTIAVVRHHTGTASTTRSAWLTLTSSRLLPGLAPPFAHRSNSSSGVSQSSSTSPSDFFLSIASRPPAGHRGMGSSTPLTSFTSLTMTSKSSAVVANRSMSSMAP